jgi:hypothetical protein
MIGNSIGEIIKYSHERPVRVLFALLLLWIMTLIIVMAGELVIVCIGGATALILFMGGLLLIFSIKPRGYKSATWMTGIAFYLLLDFVESIETLSISFLNATSILTWTAVAFILLAIFGKCSAVKRYTYATLAFAYIVIRIFSH